MNSQYYISCLVLFICTSLVQPDDGFGMYPSQHRTKAEQMVEEEAMGYQGKNSEDPDAVLNELNHDEIIERDMQEVEEEILLAEGQPPPEPKPNPDEFHEEVSSDGDEVQQFEGEAEVAAEQQFFEHIADSGAENMETDAGYHLWTQMNRFVMDSNAKEVAAGDSDGRPDGAGSAFWLFLFLGSGLCVGAYLGYRNYEKCRKGRVKMEATRA